MFGASVEPAIRDTTRVFRIIRSRNKRAVNRACPFEYLIKRKLFTLYCYDLRACDFATCEKFLCKRVQREELRSALGGISPPFFACRARKRNETEFGLRKWKVNGRSRSNSAGNIGKFPDSKAKEFKNFFFISILKNEHFSFFFSFQKRDMFTQEK